jgi:hypothetical protein
MFQKPILFPSIEFITQIPEDRNRGSFLIFRTAKETSIAFSHLKSLNIYMNLRVNKFIWLCKVQVVPVHTMKAHRRSEGTAPLTLTPALDGVRGQAQSLAVFPLPKSNQNALNRRLCGLNLPEKT